MKVFKIKPTKVWRDMFNESLKGPNFRKECEDATAKLASLIGPTQHVVSQAQGRQVLLPA